MTTITIDPRAANAADTFAHIPSLPAGATSYSITTVSSRSTDRLAAISTKSEVRFSDPVDQKAWEAYKKIEPRYSDANRLLAE